MSKAKRGLLRAIKTCDFNVNLYNTAGIYLEKYFSTENYFKTCICEYMVNISTPHRKVGSYIELGGENKLIHTGPHSL